MLFITGKDRIIVLSVLLMSLMVFQGAVMAQTSSTEIYFSQSVDFDFNKLFGSDGYEFANHVVTDSKDNIIVSSSVNYDVGSNPLAGAFGDFPRYGDEDFQEFPITQNAFDTSYNDAEDIVLSKFSPNGDLIYSTYFGGSERDIVTALTVSPEDDVIIGGYTTSDDFPVTNGRSYGKETLKQGFLSKFSENGTLLHSTYFGGTYIDQVNEIRVDGFGYIYLSGYTKSPDFPLVNAAYSNFDDISIESPLLFATKLTEDFSIEYSTLLGGSSADNVYTMELTDDGQLIVTGSTKSEDFPITDNAPDKDHNGLVDAFYTRFDEEGQVAISTFIGGFYFDMIYDSDIFEDNSLVMVGFSNSGNYPLDEGEDRILNTYGKSSESDAIITRIDLTGQVIWSTFLGGDLTEVAWSVEIDDNSQVIVGGTSRSADFPIWGVETKPVLNRGMEYEKGVPTKDIFVATLVDDGRLAYSYLVGSTAEDDMGDITVAQDGTVVFVGNTQESETYPNTNNFPYHYFENAILAKVEQPFISLPEGYIGYRGSQDQNVTLTGAEDGQEILSDPISVGILVLSSALILGNVVRVVKNITHKETSEKSNSTIMNYLNRLRKE